MIDEPEIKEVKPGVRIRDKEPSLQDRLGINVREAIGEEQIQQAQSEIDALEDQYPAEATHEITQLMETLKTFQAPLDKESELYKEFFSRVLDLKSTAGLFGYPLATHIANSLFNFGQNDECATEKSIEIIRLHVATLHRIFEDDLKDDKSPSAQEIVKQFKKLTE